MVYITDIVTKYLVERNMAYNKIICDTNKGILFF